MESKEKKKRQRQKREASENKRTAYAVMSVWEEVIIFTHRIQFHSLAFSF